MKQFHQLLFVAIIWLLAQGGLHAQPVADFRANITSGCAPIIVSFEDLSTGAVSWSWSTGVGTSNLQNPGIFYTNPGSYSVTLVVTDAQGLKDTITRSGFIDVYGIPVADFTVTSTSICRLTPITFNSTSTAGSGNLVSYSWDFGDGTTSQIPNPVHTYQAAGSYPVSLVVRNQYGCTENVNYPNLITVSSPEVGFTADPRLACGPPLAVTFTSNDPSGQHSWVFGDGNTGTGANPIHPYNQNGSFSVTHFVQNAQGCRDTLLKNAFVNIGVNTLGISAVDSSVCQGDTVRFLSSASANSTVLWDFGNGATSSLHNPKYKYTTSGTYHVTATISDPSGCSFSLGFDVEIYPLPFADFTVAGSPMGCDLPFQVQFQDQSTGAVSWSWTFGDGASSLLQNPMHTYLQEGNFDIRLAVKSNKGCTYAQGWKGFIEIDKLTTNIKADKRQGCAPLTVAFRDTTSSLFPVTQWFWDFGDGTTSTQNDPLHTYQDTGSYKVKLITTNAAGCTDTAEVPNYIRIGSLPVANFQPDTNQACALSLVLFNNLSTGAHEYLWLFGDGDTAMSTNPMHGFAALGPMGVMLIASDRGCADTLIMPGAVNVLAPLPIIGISEKQVCRVPAAVTFMNLSVGADSYSWALDDSIPLTGNNPVYTFTDPGVYSIGLTVNNVTTGCNVTAYDAVTVKPIYAKFDALPDEGCQPLTVFFKDSSENAVKWWWHFGAANKDTSNLKNPIFTYNAMGTFDVTLVVTNSLKCRDTLVVQDAVKSHGVVANFSTFSGAGGCIPFPVSFKDISTGTGNVVHWDWDFGDGTYSQLANPVHTYTQVGSYTVRLTVVDNHGCTHTTAKTNYVSATSPIADFLVPNQINCPDETVTFVSNSSGAGLSYVWDFGDGSGSTMANATHTYLNAGDYTINLKVTDVNGCKDSILRVNFVSVRPLKASFTADSTYASCPPLKVDFNSDSSKVHPGTTWQWSFGNGAGASQPNPAHTYTQPGVYDVRLVLIAPSGCSDTLLVPQMIEIEGPVANFTFDPKEGCPGTVVNFAAQSAVVIDYQWYFDDGNTAMGPQASYAYPLSGNYHPALLVEDSTGCKVFTVSNDSVIIYQVPVPAFTANKSLLCESGDITFVNQTPAVPGLTYTWDFGDGQTASQVNPTHTYASTGVYTVTLIVTTTQGCQDSIVKVNFIQVASKPTPEVVVADSAGCVPFGVTMEAIVPSHQSPVTLYSWNFGDNSAPALGNQANHTYVNPNAYTVTVSVTDQNGCTGDATSVINAWAAPSGNFMATDSFGCAPFPVAFHALVPSAVAWQWNFGDGNVGTGQSTPHTYTQDGVFGVTLDVVDVNGCALHLEKPDYIHLKHPVAAYVPAGESCPGTNVAFQSVSTSDTTLTRTTWLFPDGTSANGISVSHPFHPAGPQLISLVVEDVFGCTDTLTQNGVTVRENHQPVPVSTQFVTVESDDQVRIEYEPYNSPWNDFSYYVLYRKNAAGSFDSLQLSTNRGLGYFTDKMAHPDARSECYKIEVVNLCGLRSDLVQTPAHCTIDMETQPLQDAISLKWTPYVGWTPDAYQIYRVQNYGSAKQLIGIVPGQQNMFVDASTHCYDSYQYRVEAIGAYQSLSDKPGDAPLHEGPRQANNLIRATVEGNEQVLVEWNNPPVEGAASFILERNEGNGFVPVITTPASRPEVKFTDTQVEVGLKSYTYRAFVEDSCGDRTPLGRVGKTIHLQGEQTGGSAILAWTSYEGWEQGVHHYQIDLFDEQTQSYTKIGDIPGFENNFEDREDHIQNDLNCYRITAFEEGGNATFSLSNETCLTPKPRVFGANAFSPNGDGINDVFLVSGTYLDQFEMRIYNRWGEKIYTSNQPDQGWDGRVDNGVSAQEGVYMYVVSGTGRNGEALKLVGSITLIR